MKQYEDKLTVLSQAIQLNPKGAKIIARRAETYRLMACYREAISDFNCAIELVPKYVWAFAHRGESYCQMGCFHKALEDFNQAIELDPSYTWALAHRGVVYRLLEDYEKALTDFTQAINLNPDYAWAFAYRARTYELLYQYERTLADFDQAISLNETLFDDWLIKRGMILSYLGNYSEAIACCLQVLEDDPNDYCALYNLTVFKVRNQGLLKSKADVDRAKSKLLSAENSIPQGTISYRVGGLAALQGKRGQAMNCLEIAISLDSPEAIEYAPHDTAWLDLWSDSHFLSLIARAKCKQQYLLIQRGSLYY
ncbi:MAG: tetratricopeptide repeat protein [Chloroflexota bacterium]